MPWTLPAHWAAPLAACSFCIGFTGGLFAYFCIDAIRFQFVRLSPRFFLFGLPRRRGILIASFYASICIRFLRVVSCWLYRCSVRFPLNLPNKCDIAVFVLSQMDFSFSCFFAVTSRCPLDSVLVLLLSSLPTFESDWSDVAVCGRFVRVSLVSNACGVKIWGGLYDLSSSCLPPS